MSIRLRAPLLMFMFVLYNFSQDSMLTINTDISALLARSMTWGHRQAPPYPHAPTHCPPSTTFLYSIIYFLTVLYVIDPISLPHPFPHPLVLLEFVEFSLFHYLVSDCLLYVYHLRISVNLHQDLFILFIFFIYSLEEEESWVTGKGKAILMSATNCHSDAIQLSTRIKYL